MKNKGFWKIGFFVTSLILIFVVAFLAYLYGKGDLKIESLMEDKIEVKEEEEILVTPTPNMSLEIEAIKRAVFEKTGLTPENADVTVSQYTTSHAKGGVKEKEAIAGAYFIAAKENGNWICVYDGQSHPTCEQIEPFDFPEEMVPECLDASNKVIKR